MCRPKERADWLIIFKVMSPPYSENNKNHISRVREKNTSFLSQYKWHSYCTACYVEKEDIPQKENLYAFQKKSNFLKGRIVSLRKVKGCFEDYSVLCWLQHKKHLFPSFQFAHEEWILSVGLSGWGNSKRTLLLCRRFFLAENWQCISDDEKWLH